MKLSTEWIEYDSGGEALAAHLARPAGAREELPGVIVIQEVWGVDAHPRGAAVSGPAARPVRRPPGRARRPRRGPRVRRAGRVDRLLPGWGSVGAPGPGYVAAMRAAGREIEAVVYAGAPHAFFNDTRGSYRPGAARDAWARTLGFLARLAPAPTAAPPDGGGA